MWIGMLFASQVACAGTYVADTSSGGTASTSGTPSYTYGKGTVDITSGGGSGTGTISGTVSTVFRWKKSLDSMGNEDPFDLPPTKVIVLESSDVWGEAKTYPAGSPTATCQTGLSTVGQTNNTFTVPITIPIPPTVMTIGTWAYTRKTQTCPRVVDGGDTVTVTSSPSVTTYAPNGPYSVNYHYTAAAYPIKITVGDSVYDEGTYYGEISRRHTASISTTAPGVGFQSHVWSMQGAIFKSYTHDYSTSTSQGFVTEIVSGDLQVASPSWSWIYGGAWDVACNATITYNSYGYGSFSDALNVQVEEPTFSMTATTSNLSRSVLFGLSSDGNPALTDISGAPRGIISVFGGTICPHFPAGTFGNAQKINCHWAGTGLLGIVSTLGDYWLDTSYFYQASISGGSTREEVDTPHYGFGFPDILTISTSFELYQMYRSAGASAQDVCHYRLDWEWNGYYPTVSPIISPTLGLHSLHYFHPEWDHVLTL